METITLDGGLPAYTAGPEGTGPLKGGLLVIHEVWGLVDHTKDVADRFADEGYLVLAPNLLSGIAPLPELFGPAAGADVRPAHPIRGADAAAGADGTDAGAGLRRNDTGGGAAVF